MSKWLPLAVLGVVMACVAGCSNQEAGEVTTKPSDQAEAKDKETASAFNEVGLVTQLQQVRADYRRLLNVLYHWYLDHGHHDKAVWARREGEDLNRVRTQDYLQAKAGEVRLSQVDEADKSSLKSIDLAHFSEADRVEQLYQLRANYRLILQSLIQFYDENGQPNKATRARQELQDLKMVRNYPYLVEVDIQDTNLVPRDNIVEADRLYVEAYKEYKSGQVLPFMNDKRKLKDALDKFVLLIKSYPTSDKIDDAAFYAGEISKEYFDDDVQALRYYEMALKWDPRTPHPVRFQAAVVYDFRRHDRARAMALYQRVLKEEQDMDQTNTNFAATRLRQLLEEANEGRLGGPDAPGAAAPAESSEPAPK